MVRRVPGVRGFCAALCVAAGAGTVAAQDLDLREGHLRVGLRAEEQGALYAFGRNAGVANLAGPSGLLNEGLRPPNAYAPERRVNETLTQVEESRDVPTLVYAYALAGPGLDGLEATRRMTPVPGGAVLRCVWSIRNGAAEPRPVLPWLGNDLRPGGSVDPRDTAHLPTDAGTAWVPGSGWLVPRQAWFAAVDPIEQEALIAVFSAPQLRAARVGWDVAAGAADFDVAFHPATLAPGARWETTYDLGVVTGLNRVDGVGVGVAVQAGVERDRLALRIAALLPAPETAQVEGRIRTASGADQPLPPQPLALTPGAAVHVALPLGVDPGPGALLALRLLDAEGRPRPHPADAEGWFDVALGPGARLAATVQPTPARAPRTLRRPVAWQGPEATVWFEPALVKVFREDRIEPAGAPEPAAHLVCARGEAESFQVVVRAQRPLRGLQVEVGDLARSDGNGRIPASAIRLRNVAHVPIAVPSHLDGMRGDFPDPLPPHTPVDAAPGLNRAVWVTLRVPDDTPPGDYAGDLRLRADGLPGITLRLAVHVHPAVLPALPALASDVLTGPDPGGALAALLREYGLTARRESATEAEALAALRDAAALRAPSPGSVHVPPLSPDEPGALERLNAAVQQAGLAGRAFTEPALHPRPDQAAEVDALLAAWRDRAPDIAARVPTAGLDPYLPRDHPHWSVHWPMFQTTANAPLLGAVNRGTRVWVDLADLPGPPFGGLCIDRPAVEHRILGWQAWALGVAGLRLWSGDLPGAGAVDPAGIWQGPDLGGDTPAHGAGTLVYPGTDGPIPAMRLEILRDALEDHALLSLLVTRLEDALDNPGLPAAALAAAQDALDPTPLMKTLTVFSRNPIDLLEQRMRVLDALEQLP